MATSSISHDFIISGKDNVEGFVSAVENAQKQLHKVESAKKVTFDSSKSIVLKLREKVK